MATFFTAQPSTARVVMVGFSASWKVSGLVSGVALISSDWLTEMKRMPAFLVCSLMAIWTWAASPPTMNCTFSFSPGFPRTAKR